MGLCEKIFPDNVWNQKMKAFCSVQPLIRELFVLHSNMCMTLRNVIRGAEGAMDDDMPITSTKKEKSGVMAMDQGVVERPPAEAESKSDGSTHSHWRDNYFVLYEGSLYYYNDSKCTDPTGLVVLKYASVMIDILSLAKGKK